MDTAINPEPRAFYQFQATRALAEDVKPVNTLNPIGLKLFNTINQLPTAVSSAGSGTVYAMDPIDLKLFNSQETTLK